MAIYPVKQKLRLILLMMLVMGIQPMLMFQMFPKEQAGWIAGFNFVFITLLLLWGLSTMKHSFRKSLIAGVVFFVLCLSILVGRYFEMDLENLHQVSSAFYLVWLVIMVVESYFALKNKTRITDPGL